jgi:uncharacterized membrane protein YcaP (DUF421 family)
MRKELITREELISQMREQGVDDLAKVKKAYIESDGKISIIGYDDEHRKKPEQKNT